MQSKAVSEDSTIAQLRAYATRERSAAKGTADAALKVKPGATADSSASYYRARENAMDDVLRKLRELEEVRQ